MTSLSLVSLRLSVNSTTCMISAAQRRLENWLGNGMRPGCECTLRVSGRVIHTKQPKGTAVWSTLALRFARLG